MKITMDKSLTPVAQVKELRNAMKDFKARYTDGDLKRVFLDALCEINEDRTREAQGAIYCADILRCDVSAFPTYQTIWIGAEYCVEMVLENCNKFVFIRFYVNHDLKVDTRPQLITLRLFKEYTAVTM